MRRILPVVLATALSAGCVSVNRSILSRDFTAQPVQQADVQVFFADDKIPPHTRVAILNASGDSGFTNEGQMIDRLRQEAGRLGANAIILSSVREPGGGERAVAAIFGGSARRRGQAIAIRLGASSVAPDKVGVVELDKP